MPSQQHSTTTTGNAPKDANTRVLTGAFLVLIAVTTLNGLYQRGLDSGIPLYYTSIGDSATIGGTLVAIFTIASMVMRLVGGRITDTTDHIHALVAGMLMLLAGAVLAAIWPVFWMVVVARVIQGCGFAFASNVISVLIMETAPKKKLGQRISYKGVGTSLAMMFGAAIATWLLDSCNYRMFYAAYALMALAGLALVLLIAQRPTIARARRQDAQARAERRAAAHAKASWRETLADYRLPQAVPYTVIQLLRRLPKGACLSFMLVYARQHGFGTGALFFIVAGLATLVCRIVFAGAFNHINKWVLLPMMLLDVVGFGLLALWANWPTLLFAAVCYGCSIGVMSPMLKTLTSESVGKEHWGVANGELQFMGDIGRALGAFLGGLAIDMAGQGRIPLIICLFALAASVLTAVTLAIPVRARTHAAR
ncbi:MAG: MFS transporter [Bifidobacterium sp.]|nr:MFS transporter [Bifidobacterium sp.]